MGVILILACDLDRTLIYSSKFIENEDNYELVEVYEGREISFISKAAKETLRQIADEDIFVPVTTRTEAQFRRIFGLDDINIRYAIVANGGKILIDGIIDEEWDERVRAKVSKLELSFEDIKKILEADLDLENWLIEEKKAEDFFHYLIVDGESVPKEGLSMLAGRLSAKGWQLSLQGRKLYFIPKPISKEDALEYLMNKLGKDHYYAAGDSLLDQAMLERAKEGYYFKHGELYIQKKQIETLNLCEREGIHSAREFLEKYLKKRNPKN